jgi:hypothetical protein
VSGYKKCCYFILDKLSGIIILLSMLMMFFTTYILVTFTFTQVALSVGSSTSFKKQTDFFLSLINIETNNLNPTQYTALLAAVIGAVAVLVTLWFSVASLISYLKHRNELSKKALIQKEMVYTDGEEDLKVMLRYYKNANSVIVFSGDFSWISKNNELLRVIQRLSSESKISFVSYKSANVVESAIGSTLYNEFHQRFRFDQDTQLKCSLVKINHSKVFIYKVDREVEGGDKNVCIIPGKDDARYLLETLESLCKQYAP